MMMFTLALTIVVSGVSTVPPHQSPTFGLTAARTTTPPPTFGRAPPPRGTAPSPTFGLTAAHTTTPPPTFGLTAARTTTPPPTFGLTAAHTTTPPPTFGLTAAQTTTPPPTFGWTAPQTTTPPPTFGWTAPHTTTPPPTFGLTAVTTTPPPTPHGPFGVTANIRAAATATTATPQPSSSALSNMVATSSLPSYSTSLINLNALPVTSLQLGSAEVAQYKKSPPSGATAPDFAFQFSPCLTGTNLQAILNAVTNNVNVAMPGFNPWVQSYCTGTNSIIGVWLTQPTGSDTAAGRATKAQAAVFLNSGETFGIHLTKEGFLKFVEKAWASLPKKFNEQGKPSANGPLFLDDFDLSFSQQVPTFGRMILTLKGHYNFASVTDVKFTVQVVDLLSMGNAKITCSNSNNVDVDTSLIKGLIAASVFVAPFMIPALVDALNTANSYNQLPSGVLPSSAQCAAKKAIPDSIFTTGADGAFFKGKKFDLQYSRLVVNNNQGIIAAGSYALVPRVPSIVINGPSTIKGDSEDTTSIPAGYSITASELVGPLSFTWSGAGALSTGSKTAATFSVNWPGTSGPRTVTAQVVDVDGLTASATKKTTITLTPGGLPPVCQHKPDLPQCNP